nr:hypothetical protein B0A51_00062 [Rachicladosporium sp. CCFEE 5018]
MSRIGVGLSYTTYLITFGALIALLVVLARPFPENIRRRMRAYVDRLHVVAQIALANAPALLSTPTTERDILEYLGGFFLQPEALLKGMADSCTIISGSRALEFFAPGSSTSESDWDFYTYNSCYCVGRALRVLEAAGVEWDDLWKPIRDLANAGPGTKAYMHKSRLNSYFQRRAAGDQKVKSALAAIESAMNEDEKFAGIRANSPSERLMKGLPYPENAILRWGNVELLVHTLAPAVSQPYSASSTVDIISGKIPSRDNCKVQLIFSRNRSPIQQVMAFYASSVQCFLTPYGAVHLYHRQAAKRVGYWWPQNTQHKPSADAARLKYGARGWTFIDQSRLDSEKRVVRQLDPGNTESKLIPFAVDTGLNSALEANRRDALKEMTWVEHRGQTFLMRSARGPAYEILLGTVVDDKKQSEDDEHVINLTSKHTVAFADSSSGARPEHLSGV